jgi:hypothetical protein
MPSFTPIYDRKRVMSGMAQLYLAAYNETSPAVLPADTVALGAAWPTTPQPWVAIGASAEGASLMFRRSTQSLTVEEQLTPVAVETTEVELKVEVTLAQDTLETMQIAMGGGTLTTTAASSGVIGKKALVLADDLTHYALGIEAKNTYGFFRRMLVPEIVSIADVETSYRRSANLRLYKVSLWALCSLAQVDIRDKTADALP